MKITIFSCLATLFLLLLPSSLLAGGYWIRCSGSMNLLGMSDFNDGVAQMNDLVEDAYRLDLLEEFPDISDAELASQVSAATSNKLLDELDNGLGFSIGIARKVGSNLCAGLEFERMIGASDAVESPAVAMNYNAPLSMMKIFMNTHVKEYRSMSLALGGAVGYAMATGQLQMPANNLRPTMRDAYLTGGGVLFEGHLLTHYKLEEGLSLCGTIGYRLAKLDESDQNWFAEDPAAAVPGQIEIDDTIPLQLDFSGLFIKVGFQADLSW